MDRNVVALVVLLLAFAVASAACLILFLQGRKIPEQSAAVPERALPSAFRASLAHLRGKISGNRYQYRVPWVLALGEPGVGKTALLDQLAADDGGVPDDDPGVQWRFLSQGALIEAPGSFLLSGGDKARADRPWGKFLRLLLRHRMERPIDGIVLFIAAPSLLADSHAEISKVQRQTAAAVVRAKLDQLQQTLGIAAPVYVVVTKCDYIRGFPRFCETAGPQFQDDIFGWSNPNTLDTAFHVEWIDQAFESIQQNLLRHQLRVFGQQPLAHADDLFVFPLEFERLRTPIQAYLTECFEESSYLDPHFLRGIYFCGDACARLLPDEIAAADGAAASEAAAVGFPQLLIGKKTHAEVFRQRIAFARHLFEFKVFLEAGIVRSLSRVWFPRNRLTAGLQASLAVFIVLFGLGTWGGYERLKGLRDHKFKSVLDILASQLLNTGGGAQAYPLSAAYDFVDDLGILDAQGFRAFFLPASFGDPINTEISNLIATSFSQTVLPSLQAALNARATAVIGVCRAVPAAEITVPAQVDSLELRKPQNDAEYVALEKALDDYIQLRQAIHAYDHIRSAGQGSFADFNKVFVYLTGRSLQDENRFRQNPYYQRALRQAAYGPVPALESGQLDDCTRIATASRIHNFFESWFDKSNPLINVTDGVAGQIDELQSSRAASRDQTERLVNDIRGLDSMLSGGAYAWLNQADYSRANFPVLSQQLPPAPFASKPFLDTVDTDGSEHFTQTKRTLLASATITAGPVLISTVSGIRVSAQVIALQNALSALLGQDFMSGQDSPGVPAQASLAFLWNKGGLVRANQMEESHAKYLHEWLPLLPSGLRDAVRTVADRGLQSAVLSAVAKAQEPLDAVTIADPSALALEIGSFESAAPIVLQLQNVLPPPLSREEAGGLPLLLARQCLYLANRLGATFQANSLYEPAQASLQKWDGAQPLTEVGYGVTNGDELETYFARQRDQTRKAALEYAQPLAQYINAHGLAPPKNFALWPAIIRDMQDYEAKKPGNSIDALETFIRTDLNKITPKGGCIAEARAGTGSDYFLALRVDLRSQVIARCGELVKDNYVRHIAAFFNQRLAGNFPFGPLAEGPDAQEASLNDTIEFFSRLNSEGPGIATWLHGQTGVSAVAHFLQQAEASSQMFAGGLKDGLLFSDLQLTFRANRPAEVLGDRIIDWEFRAGDQVVRSAVPGGLRWSYGNPVQITLRFAKDSPETPAAGANAPDVRVAGRTITYTYTDPWALFALLRAHYGGDADYGAAAGRLLGLMRFVIPLGPGTTFQNVSAPPLARSAARVFIRAQTRMAGAKESYDVPVAAFPQVAPPLPVAPGVVGK
jgi:type VI secretion system protein ImpL